MKNCKNLMTIKFLQEREMEMRKNKALCVTGSPIGSGMVENKKGTPKADSESGRSMVEMLGVLAIMGVLVIGSLIGYQMMVTQHKINQLGTLLMQRGTLSIAYFMTHDTDLYQDEFGVQPPEGVILPDIRHISSYIQLDVTHIGQRLCQALNRNPWPKILVLRPAVCQDENEMRFLLKDDLTEWEERGDITDICQSDADCPLSQYCYQNLCHICPEQTALLPQSKCSRCGGSWLGDMCEQKCTPDQMMYYNVDGSGDLDLKGISQCSACHFNWLYTTKDECAKCQRQKPDSFYAVLWHRSTFNACASCSYNSYEHTTTLEECRNCPNRCWREETRYCMPVNENNPDTDGDGICDLNCPADRLMYYNVDHSGDWDLKGTPRCSLCHFTWLYTTQDECAKCADMNPGSFMAIKWNRETFNVCFACRRDGSVVTTLEECRRCPNRYWISETQQCAVCPEGTHQDTSGMMCVSE